MLQARQKLTLPENRHQLLLHSCCAPCAGEIMEALVYSEINFTIYFYNPNIHPRKEYELRKDENIRFAEKHHIPFVDDDYNKEDWFDRAGHLGDEPERGVRCTQCFDMRFERTADYAKVHGFDIISSTLGISRWKNLGQINACGVRAAARHPELMYWTYNWRQDGGAARMLTISKNEQFYQQQYCGCVYSLRDTNRWRLENQRPRVQLGKDFYGVDDAASESE